MTKVLCRPRRADVNNGVTNYQGSTTSQENEIRKHLNLSLLFCKFRRDYDLNLCRYVNTDLPPMRDLGSLIPGKYRTFLCGTLFGRMKLNKLYPPKQSST